MLYTNGLPVDIIEKNQDQASSITVISGKIPTLPG